ncbi:hypothetical protein FBT96_07375 [Rhodobacter capsulatus]|uniref:Uncharacterized protein n=1 Tax=Rhodobacter capsulatus TaxID=1061 RepID=A0A4U1JS17_RHOCA|nr:hypothetical protein FBT96_07375 [Rhodobacter capsulatus]
MCAIWAGPGPTCCPKPSAKRHLPSALMLPDGALRMLVLLPAYSFGPGTLAWLFLLYEVAGNGTDQRDKYEEGAWLLYPAPPSRPVSASNRRSAAWRGCWP